MTSYSLTKQENDIRLVTPQTLYFAEGETTPNNPNLPVLIYREIIDPQDSGKDKIFQRHFGKNFWGGAWKGVVFDYNHFHSNAHEALGIARGHITVRVGGERGKDIDLKSGDLLVLPAGTGHQMISQSENLLVVGCNPEGQEEYDICRSIKEDPQAKERIIKVTLPKADPFYGDKGPLIGLWSKK